MAIYSLNHSTIGRSTHAAGTAGAHIRYISRESACRVLIGERLPTDRNEAQAWIVQQEMTDRKNGRVCDKLMLALPRELDQVQRVALVRTFAEEVTQGRAVWIAAIHDKGKDEGNPHCHLVIRDRCSETGKRVAELSEKGSTERLRELWEKAANQALADAGIDARIDRRSLVEQGEDRVPQIHEGPKIRAMERREIAPKTYRKSDQGTRMDYNASVLAVNTIRIAANDTGPSKVTGEGRETDRTEVKQGSYTVDRVVEPRLQRDSNDYEQSAGIRTDGYGKSAVDLGKAGLFAFAKATGTVALTIAKIAVSPITRHIDRMETWTHKVRDGKLFAQNKHGYFVEEVATLTKRQQRLFGEEIAVQKVEMQRKAEEAERKRQEEIKRVEENQKLRVQQMAEQRAREKALAEDRRRNPEKWAKIDAEKAAEKAKSKGLGFSL